MSEEWQNWMVIPPSSTGVITWAWCDLDWIFVVCAETFQKTWRPFFLVEGSLFLYFHRCADEPFAYQSSLSYLKWIDFVMGITVGHFLWRQVVRMGASFSLFWPASPAVIHVVLWFRSNFWAFIVPIYCVNLISFRLFHQRLHAFLSTLGYGLEPN